MERPRIESIALPAAKAAGWLVARATETFTKTSWNIGSRVAARMIEPNEEEPPQNIEVPFRRPARRFTRTSIEAGSQVHYASFDPGPTDPGPKGTE